MSRRLDRACAALTGLAIGDALGMPTQTLTRHDIRRHYGEITTFVAPFDDHPVACGLRPGQVTDDTEQTFLLAARLIADGGTIEETKWAMDLLEWDADIRRRGIRDLLGPSSSAALDAVLKGMPISETGRYGTTNGAAMRIVPVGIAIPGTPLSGLVDSVERACRLTHNTGEAIAAAAAVASVVSCGLDGHDFGQAVNTALLAAKAGQHRGHREGKRDIAERIRSALAMAEQGIPAEQLAERIGTSVAACESVPMAFATVRLAGGEPWPAALIAANLGGDTDTIGAIAGAMAGACSGLASVPEDALRIIRSANDLPIEQVSKDLLALQPLPGESAPETFRAA